MPKKTGMRTDRKTSEAEREDIPPAITAGGILTVIRNVECRKEDMPDCQFFVTPGEHPECFGRAA